MRRQRNSGALQFWVGAGLGLLLSASAVAIASEFTYLRRKRYLRTGMLDDSEETLVHDLSEAVQHGLETISHAARELSHSFADARRELVRYGLDAATSAGGHDDAGWYYEEEDETPKKRAAADTEYEEQWDK
jgi:hypothetical protein